MWRWGVKSLAPNNMPATNRFLTSHIHSNDTKNSKGTPDMWKWNQQIVQTKYQSFYSGLGWQAAKSDEEKRENEKKEKGRRQVGAPAAIYPMQSEIIAYHSVVLVSFVKAQRRVLWGVRPDRRPWETITKCTLPPFLSVGHVVLD